MKAINLCEEIKRHTKEPFRWIADKTDPKIDWTFYSTAQFTRLNSIKRPYLARYLTALIAVFYAKKHKADLIVTHGTKITVWVGIFKSLLGIKTHHLAWAFTLPFYEKHSKLYKALIRFGVKDVDRFIMFSNIEIRNYPRYLNMSADLFHMIPWCVNTPQVDEHAEALVAGRYVAAMGSQGRDYKTLVEAVKTLPQIKLVIVAIPENLTAIEIPDNVQVFTQIPWEKTINIAYHSEIMVLPLLSDAIPCGHGTLITQFLLNKATIVTDSDAMEGYCFPGKNVLTYKAQDVDSLRQVLMALWDNPQRAKQLTENAMRFALTQCSEKSTIEYFHNYLYEKGLLQR